MSFRIAFIGAGSIGFTRRLLTDLLSVPELRNEVQPVFMDINEQNLEMVTQLCQRDMEANGIDTRIIATTDRREAVKDARYVFSMMRVGGLEAFETDIDIPLKYGIDQCVGDTLCAGGIMYGQRTIPVLLDCCRDIAELAEPGALFLNYSNPMAMNTWACNKYGYGVKTVGLCHGVQGGHGLLARVLGVPKEELDIVCAGINHMTWYIRVEHKGKDLTGEVLRAMENDPNLMKTEKVRIDMLRRFGYFSTESNGHLSEYVPWYRKREDEIERWIDLGSWINGETGGYLRVCREGREWFKTDFPNWMKEEPKRYAPENRSHEHGSWIIESLETGRIYRGHFNVPNTGIITNLPDDCIVEVPGYVDRLGINTPVVGDLPLGCAACCLSNINVQRLAVEAAVNGDINLLRQAFMMDPLVGAVCNPPEIWQLVDEMLVAQRQWLPQYRDAIDEAEKRLADTAHRIRTRHPAGYRGAARLKTRSVEELARNKEAARKNAEEADKAKERPPAK